MRLNCSCFADVGTVLKSSKDVKTNFFGVCFVFFDVCFVFCKKTQLALRLM